VPGVVYIKPADRQLTIAAGGHIALAGGPTRFRPPADPLFESAARVFVNAGSPLPAGRVGRLVETIATLDDDGD
jgi:hypothetical protein